MSFIAEYYPLFMFLALIPLLFTGYPVAFVLGGVGFLSWVIAVALGLVNEHSFFLVVSRIHGGVVDSLILVAIPMFVFMGTMMEKSGIARDLLLALQQMMGRIPGGLALSVVFLGIIMAATTGIIGASVVMMTLLALPVMVEQKYDLSLATGTIASSGTLGILIPPSIMLVVMGNLLSVPIGTLFVAALIPGLFLSALYVIYIIAIVGKDPSLAPAQPKPDVDQTIHQFWGLVFKNLFAPFALIFVVLGSIFGGYATPTEASGIGAAGALILALMKRNLTFDLLKKTVEETTLTSSMLFGIFLGATAFSYVFALLGGHDLIVDIVNNFGVGPWSILAAIMIMVFILGFFFDWIQITLIVLPVFAPIIAGLDFGDHVSAPHLTIIWFAILVAVNLQTSFLTPPFGFALFYMKGVAPKAVRIDHIYRGIVPFVALQLVGLVLMILWPEIVLWLPLKLGM